MNRHGGRRSRPAGAAGVSQVPARRQRPQQPVEHPAEQVRAERCRQRLAPRASAGIAGREAAGVLVGLDGGDVAADGDHLAGQPVAAELDQLQHRDAGQPADLHERAVDPQHAAGHGASQPVSRLTERVHSRPRREPVQGAVHPGHAQAPRPPGRPRPGAG